MDKTSKKRKEQGRKGGAHPKAAPADAKNKKELKADAAKKRKGGKGADAKKAQSRATSKNRVADPKMNRKVNSTEGRRMRGARSRSLSSQKKGATRAVNRNGSRQQMEMRQKEAQGGTCFLCFCCGGNEGEEMNEITMQEQLREEQEARERERRAQEERALKEQERLRKAREEEEERRRKEREAEEEAERRRNEELERKIQEELENEMNKGEEAANEMPKTVLKRIELRVKQPPKKAKLNFVGAASAPPPPDKSACVGEPPKVRPSAVSLGEGVYLIYRSSNNGELVTKFSKSAIQGSGVLAYIDSKAIPAFYFDQNKGETVTVSNMSNLMQSSFINDRKFFYTAWIEFIKKAKQFNGQLYILPASESQPPPRTDLLLLDSTTKTVTHLPVDKPVELSGNYLIAIQSDLEIFKKEINVIDVVSYVKNYGALMEL